MKSKENHIIAIKTISGQHQTLGLPKPNHPLFGIINFADVKVKTADFTGSIITHFYTIALKKNCICKTKYGQNAYDFDEGYMSFFAPGQITSWGPEDSIPDAGWSINIHPDFLRNYDLGKKIKNFGFFDYAVNEALHLSPKEEEMIDDLMKSIEKEYHSNMDGFSQDIIISQLEVLLNYANRFYARQFITRKHINSDVLSKFETILHRYYNGQPPEEMGSPTVKYFADQLHISPDYLSDLLRNLTGQNAQQHIHNKLLEKAKELLTSTHLSVSEIAYRLGFGYPQSFSKLFKTKTNLSPLEFRQSFN